MPDEVGFAGGTSYRDFACIVPASRGAYRRPLYPRLASLGASIELFLLGYQRLVISLRISTGTRSRAHRTGKGRLSRSRSRAGLRSHPEVRRGASRRRGIEWERPHTLSWRSAMADDAEWMFGKYRNRLAPILTEASSWTSDRCARHDSRFG
jgi:hypothetical protein